MGRAARGGWLRYSAATGVRDERPVTTGRCWANVPDFETGFEHGTMHAPEQNLKVVNQPSTDLLVIVIRKLRVVFIEQILKPIPELQRIREKDRDQTSHAMQNGLSNTWKNA